MAEVPFNQLYINTEDLTKQFNPSLTNYFSVYIPNLNFDGVTNDDISIFAYEAVLPGTSLEVGQIFGDRQGITESYPIRRTYPPIDVSFYVNKDYNVIRYFESWVSSIFEIKGDVDNVRYGRFNYPSKWKNDVIITKFERNFRDRNRRLSSASDAEDSSDQLKFRYILRNAFPVNIISLPVSYSQTDILRTTITFNYDFYSFSRLGNPSGSR